MEISTSPLQNKDTISNYIVNNVSYKDILPIISDIETLLYNSTKKEIKTLLADFKKSKQIKILDEILQLVETEISLNVGYLILKNHPKYKILADEDKFTFLVKNPSSKELEIVLLENERKIYVGNLTLIKYSDKNLNKIFNSNNIYQVSYISLDQRLTGQGLGGTFYKLIYDLKPVDVLLSSDNLYKGSFSVWSKTLKSVGEYHGIIVKGKNVVFPSPFNSLNTTPFNEPSIESFFISKIMSPTYENIYDSMSFYENSKTLFYYSSNNVQSLFNGLKPLEQVIFNLNDFNKLVEGDLDSEIENIGLNYKTYDLILNLQNQNIDNTDDNVNNVCIFGKNGEINISQKGNKLKINIL
jgi:hypothetical protein